MRDVLRTPRQSGRVNRAAGELRGLRGDEFLCSRRPDASLPGVFVSVTESEELEAAAFYYASSVFSFSSPSPLVDPLPQNSPLFSVSTSQRLLSSELKCWL